MYLQLIRNKPDDKATEGIIYNNGEKECFTLEDVDRYLENNSSAKIQNQTAIPRGIYKIVFHFSNHFNRMVPMLVDVPNFTYVYIHWGNKAKDTDGCILVGAENEKDNDDFIGQSKIAFDRLFKKMEEAEKRGEEITIEIV